MKSAFSETDPKYQCCCGNTTIKIGATIVGFLEMVSVALNFLAAVLTIFGPEVEKAARKNEIASPALLFVPTFIVLLIKLTIAIVLLVGIKRENPNLLLIWLIKASIGIFILLVIFMEASRFYRAFIVVGLIQIALEAWFIYIVYWCREYFIRKMNANENLEWDTESGITIVSDQYNTFTTEAGMDNPVKVDLDD